MFDPERYADDVVLTTREVAEWTGFKRSTVFSLPGLRRLEIPTAEYRYRAGDVKDAVLGDSRKRGAGSVVQLHRKRDAA